MLYKMLALNIDGTVLQSNGKLHKSTKDAIEYVANKGVYVTLFTQRSFPAAKKVAKSLKLDNLIITNGGSFIASNIDQPVFVQKISDTIVFEMVRLLESFHCQTRVITEKFSLTNRVENQNKQILAKSYVTFKDPLFYAQHYVENLGETLIDQQIAPLKMEVYFERKEDVLEVMQAFQQVFDEVVVVKINDYRLDIMPSGALKLNGLRYLCDHLDVNLEEVVVIGDGLDDLACIEVAGLGVAMANADTEVKLAADWVTRTNDLQGVSYMVKEHFRHQQPISFLKKMNILKN